MTLCDQYEDIDDVHYSCGHSAGDRKALVSAVGLVLADIIVEAMIKSEETLKM